MFKPILAKPFVHLDEVTRGIQQTSPVFMGYQKYATQLFGRKVRAHDLLVHSTLQGLCQRYPQILFCGASNVGKSSLINALMHGNSMAGGPAFHRWLSETKKLKNPTIAPVSPVPGRTRHLFTFSLGESLSLVDLPGYGLAHGCAKEIDTWALLAENYLRTSRQCRRVISLIDATLGVSDLDACLWDLLGEFEQVETQVVLTKCDLLSPQELHLMVQRVAIKFEEYGGGWPYIHNVSALNHLGILELQASLAIIAHDFQQENKRKTGRT